MIEALLALPALSIRQPWAWFILNAGKPIENRSWKTNYRGRFLIHASKGCTRDEYLDAAEFARRAIDDSYRPLTLPPLKDLPRGGIVGSVDLVDCVSTSHSAWFTGEHGFVLARPQSHELIPCKGRLGFFKLNPSNL